MAFLETELIKLDITAHVKGFSLMPVLVMLQIMKEADQVSSKNC